MSTNPVSFAQQHLQEAAAILHRLDVQAIERLAAVLADIKAANGRLFFLGVGGSAANCSHAVNDFRKLAGIECYAPTDNVAELARNISPNLVAAVNYAREVNAKVVGILGRDGGYTGSVADAAVIIPSVNAATVTPHSEAFQAVIWHLLVSHPLLKARQTKWESVDR
jgi:D-sedoheptulose 7-phosphate isomerase